MARLTIGQKAERVLEFLLALRNPRIAGPLTQHGFKQVDLDEGWQLLRSITRTQLDGVPAEVSVDSDALRALDQWENKWFVIAAATLERRAPAVHEWMFRNLAQTEGIGVVVSVGTFLERWNLLDKDEPEGGLGTAGKEAKKLLQSRGLTKETLDNARALLKKLGKIDKSMPDVEKVSAENTEFEAMERALWAWYLEWSAIARQAISQRSLLRQLGFLRTSAGGKKDDATEEELPDPTVTPGG